MLSVHPPLVVVLTQHDERARRSGHVRYAETGHVNPRGGSAVPKESVDADRRVGTRPGGRFGAAGTRRARVVVEAVPRSLFRAERARDGTNRRLKPHKDPLYQYDGIHVRKRAVDDDATDKSLCMHICIIMTHISVFVFISWRAPREAYPYRPWQLSQKRNLKTTPSIMFNTRTFEHQPHKLLCQMWMFLLEPLHPLRREPPQYRLTLDHDPRIPREPRERGQFACEGP